jgi:hypothetical protein
LPPRPIERVVRIVRRLRPKDDVVIADLVALGVRNRISQQMYRSGDAFPGFDVLAKSICILNSSKIPSNIARPILLGAEFQTTGGCVR